MLLLLILLALLLYRIFIWKPLDTSILYAAHPFLLLGHRGAPLKEAENTIPAFKQAIADGCHGIELDIRRTRDGHLVVIHDETLERTTNGSGRISDHTLAELQTLNAAHHHPGKTVGIPTLEAVVKALPVDTILNFELKDFSIFSSCHVGRDVVRFVQDRQLKHRVIISSFNPLNIWRVKLLDSSIFTALLWFEPRLFSLRHQIGIVLAHPDILHPFEDDVSRGLLFWARLKQLPLHVWVVNSTDRMLAFADDPMVRGIISDNPELLVKTLGKR